MIKGLAITPPVLGRISIGKIVEKNGKRLPEKDDQFTITSQTSTGRAITCQGTKPETQNHTCTNDF